MWFFFVLCICAVSGQYRNAHRHGGAQGCNTAARPNIVVLMADDVGVSGFGFSAKEGARIAGRTDNFFEALFPGYTPNIDALADAGIKLNRFYAYSECTPSRMAFLSGRLPVHNGVIMKYPNRWDGGHDKDSGYDGLNPNVTCFGVHLQKQGYRTHIVGKMDGFGVATPRHLAVSPLRGFDSALGYIYHANDLLNYTVGPSSIGQPPPCPDPYVMDFLLNNHSAKNSTYYNCTGPQSAYCEFEEDVFTRRAIDLINTHDKSSPLFLWYSSHQAHTPFQAPANYMQRVQSLCGNNSGTPYAGMCGILERQQYLASIMQFDDHVGQIVAALRARQMFENTLILFTSDNGAGTGAGIGGNNYPLRGSKSSNFEGGIRVPAFVSGGAIPWNLRNTSFSKPAIISDWYATFCTLAGGDICTGWGADPTGEVVPGIVPVESVNLWPYLTGKNNGYPHPVLHVAPNVLLKVEQQTGKIYKLLTTVNGYNFLTGPSYPNCTVCRFPNMVQPSNTTGTTTTTTTTTIPPTTAPIPPPAVDPNCGPSVPPGGPGPSVACQENATGPCIYDASRTCCSVSYPSRPCCLPGTRPSYGNPLAPPPFPLDCGYGCLFEITTDYAESTNLNQTMPLLASNMAAILSTLNRTYYEPFRGCNVIDPFCAGANFLGGTYGPFLNVPGCPGCIFTTPDYF